MNLPTEPKKRYNNLFVLHGIILTPAITTNTEILMIKL